MSNAAGEETDKRARICTRTRNTYVGTGAHTHARTGGERERRKGRDGRECSGSLSLGNTPNSRYIQAEPTINLVPRRRVVAQG